MNCKQGDLAVIVRSLYGNTGKIVKCIRPATQAEFDEMKFGLQDGPVWLIDRRITLKNSYGRTWHEPFAHDQVLRPLRDNPGTDETLDWIPVPHKEAA